MLRDESRLEIHAQSVHIDFLEGELRQKTYVLSMSKRRSASLLHDGRDYYKNYDYDHYDANYEGKMKVSFADKKPAYN
jgi:hypothetical protein